METKNLALFTDNTSMPILSTIKIEQKHATATTLDEYICLYEHTDLLAGCYSIDALRFSKPKPDSTLDDYPSIAGIFHKTPAQNCGQVKLSELQTICKHHLIAITDKSRLNLYTLCINPEHIVSTNGHVIIYQTNTILHTTTEILLPRSFAYAVSRFKLPDELLTITRYADSLVFSCSSYDFGCRLVDTQYVDYRQAIPATYEGNTVTIPIAAQKQLRTLKPTTADLLKVGSGKCEYCHRINGVWHKVSLPCNGNSNTVYYDPKLLLSLLPLFGTKHDISLNIIDNYQAGQIQANSDLRALIMPMRVDKRLEP